MKQKKGKTGCLLLATLLCGQIVKGQQSYPKITGYFSVTHPVGTWNKEGMKYYFRDDYTIIFPVGINLMKSERFGFSFELSPAIKSDSSGTFSSRSGV